MTVKEGESDHCAFFPALGGTSWNLSSDRSLEKSDPAVPYPRQAKTKAMGV